MKIPISLIIASLFYICDASKGDNSPYYQNCVKICKSSNCTQDGLEFLHPGKQPLVERLLVWSCHDECTYECMWKTTKAFLERNWEVPQFHGKWPFVRFLGLQEPASVVFSLANLAANLYMLRQFRARVRRDSPNYWLWHCFGAICCNAWLWSTIFHARDFPITELFDYAFAYSIVISSLCCALLRFLHSQHILVRILVAICCVIFFLNHFAYLSVGRLDYRFNMQVNVLTGILGGSSWLIWYICTRRDRKYSWKILVFQILAAASLLLELNDFPPIFYTFDAHSLWHLATVPLTLLFYSFLIDDCISLRREKFFRDEELKKLI
ncbi:post-GPI attachment to proteins factor 3 [Lutzomyia longipalpis]|uniref:post-GPI attachment to proteins factor 3 n=1 Tax=Lutzomyia longipalpis TaxID=7200 RepID=UPI00248356CE|nr:post-GPI attachment to proteins factor 3 [Lutzomyia longipalpis]